MTVYLTEKQIEKINALVKFLQLNGYHFSVSVEEAIDMCVTIAVEALTDEKMISYSKWVSEHSIREKVKK